MPQNVALAAFIFGAILALIALLGGGFELFGAKILGQVGRSTRVIAGVAGIGLMLVGLLNPFDRSTSPPLASILPTAAAVIVPTTVLPAQSTVSATETSPQLPTTMPPTAVRSILAPTPTPGDTQADSILEEKQTWRKEGVELTLTGFQFTPNLEVRLYWSFVNNSNTDIYWVFSNSDFSLQGIDKNGSSFDLSHGTVGIYLPVRVLKPGEGFEGYVIEHVDISNKKLSEVGVIVSNIPQIVQAKWKIPVPTR